MSTIHLQTGHQRMACGRPFVWDSVSVSRDNVTCEDCTSAPVCEGCSFAGDNEVYTLVKDWPDGAKTVGDQVTLCKRCAALGPEYLAPLSDHDYREHADTRYDHLDAPTTAAGLGGHVIEVTAKRVLRAEGPVWRYDLYNRQTEEHVFSASANHVLEYFDCFDVPSAQAIGAMTNAQARGTENAQPKHPVLAWLEREFLRAGDLVTSSEDRYVHGYYAGQRDALANAITELVNHIVSDPQDFERWGRKP